ncbi:cold shock protein-like protein [Dermatophagoides farinae]|uniref:Cold shock protein-like protein n=1 Tax=Dermatophagoides farinae TaxID=6954 RepID=A0A9D4NQG9_DERFA|nr:cold shock protein-like protein [Dermatophagoides farinae]
MNSNKLKLFDDNDDEQDVDEEELNFEDKIFNGKQLSEKKTSKLIELKSRLAHDSLIGKNLNPPWKSKPTTKPSLFVPRFDPTKEECSQYELKQSGNESNRKRKLSSINLDEIDRKIELQKQIETNNDCKKLKLNENQNECYYEVGQNLKNLFDGQTEDFTFGSSIFGQNEHDKDDDQKEYEEIPIQAPKLPKFLAKNRHNDSSDNDEDDERSKKSNQSITFGGFFFKADDARLHETHEEEQFFSPELIQKINQTSKERQLNMIRALSLRKKSSLKNQKTAEKYDAKQKQHKRFILQQKRRKKYGRRQFKNGTMRQKKSTNFAIDSLV